MSSGRGALSLDRSAWDPVLVSSLLDAQAIPTLPPLSPTSTPGVDQMPPRSPETLASSQSRRGTWWQDDSIGTCSFYPGKR